MDRKEWPGVADLPKVAILIAARNEEGRILSCLRALSALDYPPEKLEIIIGNDRSEDATAEIVREYIRDYKYMHLTDITTDKAQLVGKANVMAQLAQLVTAEWIFMTDADVRVGRGWIKGMLNAFSSGAGLISGSTVIDPASFFGELQKADWLYHLGIRYVSGRLGWPMGATGTNMAIKRSVYFSVGGFEKCARSITEDYDLSRAVIKQGFGSKTVLTPDVVAYTDPVASFRQLISQQRRWLSSAFRMPFLSFAGLLLQNTLLFLIAGAAIYFRSYALLAIFAIKWVADILLMRFTCRKLGVKPGNGIYLYTPYAGISNAVFLVSAIFISRNEWKGRKYSPGVISIKEASNGSSLCDTATRLP